MAKGSRGIPWKELEGVYTARHAKRGGPSKGSRLIVGLLVVKHMTGLSDEGVVESVRENPYQQAFCGFDQLVTEKILDPSTLTKQRKRLGKEFFEELEKKVYEVLIEKKLPKAKGMYVDATVLRSCVQVLHIAGIKWNLSKGMAWYSVFFDSVPLLQNTYIITVSISSLDGQIDYDYWPNAAQFIITSSQDKNINYLPVYDFSLIRWPFRIVYSK